MNKKLIMISLLIVFAIAFAFAVVFGKSLFTGNVISPIDDPTPRCDPTLWNHVWNRSRLTIIENCTSVTGTIISSFQVNDGDQHIQLYPDKQYLYMLNQNNIKFQLSSLVVEPICTHDPTEVSNSTFLDAGIDFADGEAEPDSIEACKGYYSDTPVYIPKVGEHVRVTGSYVLDTLHDWMEIHPVTKIEVIK